MDLVHLLRKCADEMGFPRITHEQPVQDAKEKAASKGGLNFFDLWRARSEVDQSTKGDFLEAVGREAADVTGAVRLVVALHIAILDPQ